MSYWIYDWGFITNHWTVFVHFNISHKKIQNEFYYYNKKIAITLNLISSWIYFRPSLRHNFGRRLRPWSFHALSRLPIPLATNTPQHSHCPQPNGNICGQCTPIGGGGSEHSGGTNKIAGHISNVRSEQNGQRNEQFSLINCLKI